MNDSQFLIRPVKPRRERRFRRPLTQTQFIAAGFLALILAGTFLLMLPSASRDGVGVGFLDALFTSTSATCVTGLVIRDTWTQWTLFGQIVILCLIQIGGLGFVTVGVFFAILLRRRIGLRQRGLMQESSSALKIGGMVKLTKRIVRGTILFEGAGALLLAVRFVPQYGFLRGIYYGIFHSVSAFCNAGFDLMGHQAPYNSLVSYQSDWLVNLVIMSLIIVGGIGFIVWEDISRNRLHFRKYMLQTKIVLVTTAALIFGGAALFAVLERNNLFADMSVGETVCVSLFNSVTARTAGFNTIDSAAMTDGSKLVMLILMFIGGSPGSTAGGVKTTSIIVLFIYVRALMGRTYSVNVFGRRLEDDAVERAAAVTTINMALALGAALLIMIIQPFAMGDILFETFSAIGTVGISTGITRDLLPASRLIIIFLMYCGRLGSMSFALAFTQQKRVVPVQNPVERMNVG